MKTLSSVILLLLLAAEVDGQQPTAKRLTSPHDAVSWAGLHVQTLPEDQRPHVRYFWDHHGKLENGQALTYTLNAAVSHSATIVQPQLVPNTKNQLWWIDIRRIYPRAEEYVRGHALWESMDQFEPYFHVINTINKIETVERQINTGKNKLVNVTPYWGTDSRGRRVRFTQKWVPETKTVVESKVVGVAQAAQLNALVCDPLGQGTLLSLTTATASNNPIMRLDWFIIKALTTEQNGFYYKFLFIDDTKEIDRDGKKVKVTAQQQFLEKLGADEKLVANLRSDNRTVIFRSNVAGKRMRLVELYYGVNARPVSGVPLITMTHDVFADDLDPKRHPLRNLVTFYNVETNEINDRARECIGVRRNGFQIFALFNEKGDLQSRVPDNVARDHTVPAPFSGFLQPGISCIRCHGSDDGWIPLKNDLDFMLSRQAGKPRLDIFDDIASKGDRADTLDRLAGQFKASDRQLDNALRLARNGYADSVFRATKFSWLRTQGLTVPQVSRILENMYAEYMYQPINQRRACYELGFAVDDKWAGLLFSQILPPLPANQYGFSPEDPIIGGIRSGTSDRRMGVSRSEWEQVFQDAKIRVLTQQAILKAGRTQK